MSKPNGISRVRRKRVSNVKTQNKSVLRTKSNENKSISDLFSDFDLSDIKLNNTFNNNSFKSTKSFLNSTDRSIGATNQSNISHSFSTKSLVNDLDLNQNHINVSNFEKAIPFVPIKSSSNKRKSVSLFDDFDLSDLKVETSVPSFQSSRKVIRTEENETCNSPNLTPESNKENNTKCDNQLEDKSSLSGKGFDFSEPLSKIHGFNNIRQSTTHSIHSTIEPNVNQRNIIEVNCGFDPFSQELNDEINAITDKSVLNSTNSLVSIENSVPTTLEGLPEKLQNVFKDFDLNDVKLNNSFKSFENVSKVFKRQHLNRTEALKEDYSSFFSIDSKSCNSFSVPETARKTLISNIFDDLDFTDLKFEESNVCFRNSRTAYQSLESTDTHNNKKTKIDWNDMNELFNQSFTDSQDFKTSSTKPKTSSPKPKTSSPKINSKSPKPKSSSPKPGLKSKEIDFSFEIDDEFFDSCIERTEQKSVLTEIMKDSNSVKVENHSDDSFDSLQDISFSLRSDFATHNEQTSQQFFDQFVEEQHLNDNIENLSFMGFRSGSGQPIHLNEDKISSAKLIFKDIEECLFKEITENKTDSIGGQTNYSQKFVTDVGNVGQTVVNHLNNLLEDETIESFAEIMSSTFDN